MFTQAMARCLTLGQGRRGSSEDDLPLRLNHAQDRGDGRGLNPSPDGRRPAAFQYRKKARGKTR